jgi:hypothetical protein
MMNNYVPFLKFKSNEVIAIGELSADVFERVSPFFDFPRPNEDKTTETFLSDIKRLSKSVSKHIPNIQELYVDTYDYDHADYIDGKYSYYRLVESLKDIKVVPVVSIDRSDDHLNAVLELQGNTIVQSDVVALRLTIEDFANYNVVKDEISEFLGGIFDRFEEIDLIFDCRVCSSLDEGDAAQKIVNFSRLFEQSYAVRKKITTGSSIPASISEILPVNSELDLDRKEIQIYQGVIGELNNDEFIFGDYATVSPNYSDVKIIPEMMQNIMTAKLTYTYADKHFLIRAGSLKTNGYGQYFDLARSLVSRNFFRGENYSNGDAYFEEKSRREGSNCMPGTIIKPSVNAHITFVVRDFAI